MNHVRSNVPQDKLMQNKAGSVSGLKTSDKTLQLVSALHSSLDVRHVILYFTQALADTIHCEGLRYHHELTKSNLKLGRDQKNKFSYNLKAGNMSLGEVHIMRSAPFTESEVLQIEDLLVLLINPLRNAIVHNNAVKSARIDPLTNLNNRSTLDSQLSREIKLAQRHSNPLSILMMDLDNFKQLNDTYGHPGGDEVLKAFADILRDMARETDLIYRIGGEEFIIILTNTDMVGANILAERIRVATEAKTCEFNGTRINYTTSVGVANLHSDDTMKTLVERADQALYRAKHAGKNQVQN